ncbi:hypothetical protein Y1Q_0020809 [Alligator mississippiensis]|uniref:Uncharacterized protein n=1 Tax=Alligator mississippiensis TaxID=8496 RepID=A0A151NDL0_ALLMI|nr:hypothetical protein Y1Q_0020809 [Alligator mississippiensis]
MESSGSNSYSDSCVQTEQSRWSVHLVLGTLWRRGGSTATCSPAFPPESRVLRGAGNEGSRFQHMELPSSGA